VGANRRRRRGRRGTTSGGAGASAAQRPSGGSRKAGWRETVDSFGGFMTIGAAALALVVVGVIVVGVIGGGGGVESSGDPLLGEEIAVGRATHIATLEEMEITPGLPPVGGPHFPVWLDPGVYGTVSDGNAVHSLEHGMIWISYNASMVSEEQIAELEGLYDEFSNDVIISERDDNAFPVAIASWGRLLRLDAPDLEQMREFVTTNRNRSPEPGVRNSSGFMPLGSDEQ
jgi:hypothetical protein